MEKIQSAIAKARAERQGLPPSPASAAGKAQGTPRPVAGSPRHVAAAGTSEDSVQAAWKALPVLKYNAKSMKRSRIVTLEGGKNGTAIDMMRTRVLQQMRDNGWRRLAITSPTAACGKSTVAMNLAFSLQRQPDLRTLLLELDLRRPALAKMMGLSSESSFASVLDGTGSFDQHAMRYGANLAVATNTRPWRDPAELLASRHIPAALEGIEEAYAPDLMIFDMPPMLSTDDMMAFARHVDCVLLVAGAESTSIKEVDICEQELASQTNVMGVILNKCRYMGPEYSYGDY